MVIKKGLELIKNDISDFKKDINGKRFLVTGGAGFIGSWICDVLIDFGGEVVCLDNLCCGKLHNVEHLLDNKKFTFIKANVADTKWMEEPEIKERFDFVLHLAARADPKDYQNYPIDTMLSNSLGTLHTLRIAERDNAIYYYSSTSEVYGNPEKHPQSEDYWGNVNPIGPRSCYDEAKRFSEALCMAFWREKGLQVKKNRIFNTYGPRLQDGRALPTFISQALKGEPITVFGDGSQTRSLCYITDMVSGIFRTIFLGRSGEVYNLGNPHEITILELAKLVKQFTGSNSPIVFHPLPKDDPLKRKPDINKAKRELGYEPKVPLEEGVKRTIEWFKSVITK
jgi:nucleoside-diphosphate-sugar epimerase